MNTKPSVKINMIMNGLLVVSSTIFPLITFPYTSRVLGPAGIGKVSLATSYVSYFVGLSQLGIPIYAIRACAKVREDKEELTRVTQELIIINFILGIISYLGFFTTIVFVGKVQNEKILYSIISTTIVFNMIGIEWLYKGLEQYTYITARSIIFKLIALVSLLCLVKSESDYIIYGAISIFANSASSVLNFIHSRKILLPKLMGNYNFKRHIKPITLIYIMSVATSIYENLDTVMLGFLCNEEVVGFYNTAIKIKNILIALITSAGAVLLPRSAVYFENNKFDLFEKSNHTAMIFVVIISVPVLIFFMIYAQAAILFIAGEQYMRSIFTMRLLLPTILVIGITYNIGMSMFVPIGKEKYVCIAAIAGALTDFCINAALIPRYYEKGAAIGTLISECIVLVVEGYFVSKIPYMRNILSHLPWLKVIIAIIGGTAMSIVVFPLKLMPFYTLLVSAGLFFGVYFALLLLQRESLTCELMSSIWLKMKGRKK